MKKRLFAVLMAVCLVLSTCVLFASAATTNYKVGDYLIGSDDSLKVAKSGTDYNIALTISAKSNATLPVGTTTLSASNIDDVFTFKAGTKTVKYSGTLDKYITIDATVDSTGTLVTINDISQESAGKAYVVATAFDDESPIAHSKCSDYLEADKVSYDLYDDADVLAMKGKTNSVKLVSKLQSLTTGVRFFGSTYNNLVASEIAQVEAVYTRNGNEVKSVTNKIEDLMTGEEVNLTASLKFADKDEDGKNDNEKFYAFYCWVDASGTVLSTSKSITWVAGTSPSAVYATFVETVDRVRISYSAGENGKIVYNEGREIFKGDGQISVLEGKEATFTFVPDEGYEVATVVINGKKNVSSILNLLSDFSLEALKDLINATNKEVYSYTFTAEELTGNVEMVRSIAVTFQKVEALEAPDGKDLPTVAPEGITLATGVAGEEAEGNADATTVPAEKNNGSDGSSDGIVNPQTGSASAVAVFAVLSVAAGAAFVTSRKKD